MTRKKRNSNDEDRYALEDEESVHRKGGLRRHRGGRKDVKGLPEMEQETRMRSNRKDNNRNG